MLLQGLNGLFFIVLLLVLHSVKADSQVFRRVANVVELLEHQVDLLVELPRAGVGSEFNSLDEGTLELLIQLVSSLDLKDVVAQSDDIRYRLHLKFCCAFEESPDFPFLEVVWKLRFKFRPS